MFSLFQTYSSGYKYGEVPYDEYKCLDHLFGKVGIRRVETKRFIRFENCKVNPRINGYWFLRQSYWFISFPYCKIDKQ